MNSNRVPAVVDLVGFADELAEDHAASAELLADALAMVIAANDSLSEDEAHDRLTESTKMMRAAYTAAASRMAAAQ